MAPFVHKANLSLLSDHLFYFKAYNPKESLKGKFLVIKDPSKTGELVLRKVIAEQGEWVQRKDNGGIIRIPHNHLWVEAVNPDPTQVTSDSISDFGPISRAFVQGEAIGIVWPFWRISNLRDQERYSKLFQK